MISLPNWLELISGLLVLYVLIDAWRLKRKSNQTMNFTKNGIALILLCLGIAVITIIYFALQSSASTLLPNIVSCLKLIILVWGSVYLFTRLGLISEFFLKTASEEDAIQA